MCETDSLPRHRAALRASVILLAAVLAASTGCASSESVQRVLTEVNAARAQIDDLRKIQEANNRELARMGTELKALEAKAATLTTESSAAGEQITRVQAALEQTDGAVRSLRGAVDELARKPVVVTAPPPPEARPQPEPPARESVPERLFATALANFQAQEHGQAVLDFTDLIAKFPRHPLASSAQFWTGEAYYRQRDFRQALTEFHKVVVVYPRSQHVPDAILKMGMCYRAMHDIGRARQSWERVAREHPGSDAAAQARSLLAAPASSVRGAR